LSREILSWPAKKERFIVYGQITVSEGVTIPVQKINKVRFIESCGQKTRATCQIQDERAWKGSGRPVRGTYGRGSTSCASAEVPRRQWVRRTSIPAVEAQVNIVPWLQMGDCWV